LGDDVFVKPRVNRKEIINSILTPIDLDHLTLAMVEILSRHHRKKAAIIRKDRLSIKEKLMFLSNVLKEDQKTTFEEILGIDGDDGRDNVVVTFISLLELARLGRISIFQNENCGPVYINVVRSLEDFDINSANGFDYNLSEETIESNNGENSNDDTFQLDSNEKLSDDGLGNSEILLN